MEPRPRAPRTLDATAAALVRAVSTDAAGSVGWESLRDAAAAQLFAALGRGDLDAARRLRDSLQAAQPFVDRARPALEPDGEAAVALSELLHLVHLGAEALERPAAEGTLKRPGDTGRLVLGVLRGAENALTRGEVHARLPVAVRPTTARISQILDDFVRLGFATRLRVAQGERVTGHYALSEAGESLCRQLGIAATESDAARLARVRGGATSRGRTYTAAELHDMVPQTINWPMS